MLYIAISNILLLRKMRIKVLINLNNLKAKTNQYELVNMENYAMIHLPIVLKMAEQFLFGFSSTEIWWL